MTYDRYSHQDQPVYDDNEYFHEKHSTPSKTKPYKLKHSKSDPTDYNCGYKRNSPNEKDYSFVQPNENNSDSDDDTNILGELLSSVSERNIEENIRHVEQSGQSDESFTDQLCESLDSMELLFRVEKVNNFLQIVKLSLF